MDIETDYGMVIKVTQIGWGENEEVLGVRRGENYVLDSQMTMNGMPGAPDGGGAAMVVKAKTTGERIGECKKS